MDVKKCSACVTSKPLTEFNRKGQSFHTKCKACQKTYWDAWYANPENQAKHVANSVRNRKVDREKNLKLLIEAKNKPCADCGEKYPPYVMDFDHLPGAPKVANVAAMPGAWSEKTILAEIAKCEVVCANCHRERTYQRRSLGVIV